MGQVWSYVQVFPLSYFRPTLVSTMRGNPRGGRDTTRSEKVKVGGSRSGGHRVTQFGIGYVQCYYILSQPKEESFDTIITGII